MQKQQDLMMRRQLFHGLFSGKPVDQFACISVKFAQSVLT